MAVARQYAASVGTSATVLEGTQYYGWVLKNNGSQTIYIGDSNVTTANGFPIAPGVTFSPSEMVHRSLTGKVADRLYAVVASGTGDVRILLAARFDV